MWTEKKDNVESVATKASENKDDDELTIDTEAPPAAGEWSQAIQEKNLILNLTNTWFLFFLNETPESYLYWLV